MKYRDCIEDLYKLVDYERLDDYPAEFDLSHFRSFLADVGNPHHRLARPVIVTGTKGKGSTVEILASCLEASGKRVGVFTSPHLVSVRERVRINRDEISEDRFSEMYGRMRPFLRRRPGGYRTVFEVLAAIAFEHFSQEDLDYTLLEVGMGGLNDATNVADPVLSVLTPISLDHTHVLGATVEEIAEKKMGIARKGVPVVCAPQCGGALGVIERICRELGAPLRLIGRDTSYRIEHLGADGSDFSVGGSSYRLNLLGEHQVVNAVTAHAAAEVLGEHVRDDAFSRVGLRGRFEIIGRDPLLVLDAAHNAHSAQVLARALKQLLPGRRVLAVVSMLKRKDHAGFARELCSSVSRVFTTRVDSPRALPAGELALFFRGLVDSIDVVDDSREAFALALRSAHPGDVVLVTGSFYLVGEVLAARGEGNGSSRRPE